MKKDKTSKKNVILIPVEKLQEGFDLCKKQMEMLIESSQILYNSKKYSPSIALSVLAREESAKLERISQHITLSLGISKKEWSSMTQGFVHEKKLVNPVKFAVKFAKWEGKKRFEKMERWGEKHGYGEMPASYEDFMKVEEKHYERLRSLNEIKKECFYVDWKESCWKILFNRSEEELEALSLVELTGMKYLFYGFVKQDLMFKKGQKSGKELDTVKEKFDDIDEFMKTKQFKIKAKVAWSIYEEYFKS